MQKMGSCNLLRGKIDTTFETGAYRGVTSASRAPRGCSPSAQVQLAMLACALWPLSNSCESHAACAEVVRQSQVSYGKSFPARPTRWKACRPNLVAANLRLAPRDNASATAEAFLSACSEGSAWTADDADGYFNATWQPGSQAGGADCSNMTRFGPPWKPCAVRELAVHSLQQNPKVNCIQPRWPVNLGDGGKTVCAAEALLRPQGCVVVSVGINANTEFEEALHRAHPHCRIVGYDGTLSAAKRARAQQRAPFLELHEHNFGAALAANYSTTSVRLLKIDCDGCEFSALPAWVTTVCTDQIVVEVHRTLRWKPKARVRIIHALMLELDKLYRIFYLETNAAFPWLGTEYSLVRRTPCHRVEDLSE